MPPFLKKPGLGLILLLAFSIPGIVSGQESADRIDWNAKWIEMASRENPTEAAQLQEQTGLLLEWGESTGWSSGDNWDQTVELLREWEESPEIEIARSAYLRILDAIGWGTLTSGSIMTHESELREFYQRGLRITRNTEEESTLLFHLAASIYRSEPDSDETRRRIEAYLEQASLAAGTEAIAGNIHLLMGDIYAEWGSSGDSNGREEGNYYSQAVFHYQYVGSLVGLNEQVYAAAEDALEKLLKSGLKLHVENRYDPEDDIRVKISTRNLARINIKVAPVSWLRNEQPVPMDELRAFLESSEFNDASPVIERSISVALSNRVDWQENEIQVGGPLPAGWYGLQVQGGGETHRDLLLVTSLETVLIPHGDSVTLWAINAESAEPVQDMSYHVYNSAGSVLYSGFTDLLGMADIVMGKDEGWSEVQVNSNGNPAFIRKEDLIERPDQTPWIIPDAMRVYPGDQLSWSLFGNFENESGQGQSMVVILPDGGNLIPRQLEKESGNLFSIGIPLDVESFGPVYLRFQDGKRILLSHLQRQNNLPLSIEFEGERFLYNKNVFVSSAPVGARIFQVDPENFSAPGYIRVVVEILDRRVVYDDESISSEDQSEAVFEHITRLGDASLPETYWEFPEVEQSDSPVTLRVKVFPLDSDELLAESYLAMIPYRARVSLNSSERIIKTGDSIQINVLDVDRGMTLTRPPQGELVAFRENWENRYIHRKKGTFLSDEEYNALPDRSLLGSAKTDYRLLQRRIVREEIFRRPLDLSIGSSLPIQFDRHGYYRIEFQGRDTDVKAHYPDGPLEVWVIPESGELDTFSSQKPRLIVEQTSSGKTEILVLVDRSQVSVLLDLQSIQGASNTQFIRPDSSGYFIVYDNDPDPLTSCLVIVSGERRTDFLCHHFSTVDLPRWDVEIQQVNGLNPGSEFQWNVEFLEGTFHENPVWTIYPEEEVVLTENLLLLQKLNHQLSSTSCQSEVAALNSRLPLFLPIASGPESADNSSLSLEHSIDMHLLESVYPEIGIKTERKGGFVQFKASDQAEDNRSFNLSGNLPLSAGRWAITSFSPVDFTSFSFEEWVFSTELPIRVGLTGPPVIRSGDVVFVSLEARNTTRRQIDVSIKSEVEPSLILVNEETPSFQLPAGESVVIPIPVEGGSPGKSKLMTTIQGFQSMSTAFWETEVLQKNPSVKVQGFFVPKDVDDWQKPINLEGWNSPRLLVSSGIGAHLQFLWPAIRGEYLERDPMLASLIDWALSKVTQHHGLDEDASSLSVEAFKQSIASHSSNSGLSWTIGNRPDPWLSALVFWSLETFSKPTDETFIEESEGLRSYLESVLINTSNSIESRIFALRALAVAASKNPRIRPSRIQAKSFLEFFHNRDELSIGNAAMLMETAMSYRFTEEVQLLRNTLSRRLREADADEDPDLWQSSLAYLVISQESRSHELSLVPLRRVIENAGNFSNHSGWHQTGAFINLLAAFLWDGDFSVDGTAVVQSGNGDPLEIQLRPHADNGGQLILSEQDLELQENNFLMKLNTSSSDQPVVITVVGELADFSGKIPAFANLQASFSREYIEHTLLAGSHVHSMETNLQETFYPQDTLKQTLFMQMPDSVPYGELSIMVPAGAVLSNEDLEHNFRPESTEAILEEPLITLLPRTNPLIQKVRIEPFWKGRHEFVLPFKISWTGDYRFPPHQLIYPDTGISYRVGTEDQLRVELTKE